MSEKGKIKNLKSKLEGSRLDLSLSELTSVPSSKEILNLKKVTEIDLSRNRLQSLNDDFCLIYNLTWLDLSSNVLKSLPEHFGKLSALQHLDLYQNQLTELPLSFCQLKQLRWLDLKDNPLKEPFRAAAGECLEPKDCKMAATKVVQYVQRLQSDHERERQKRLKIERDAEATRKAAEEGERKNIQQEKKKQKENKKKTIAQQQNNKRSEAATRRDSTSDTSEQEILTKQRSKRSQRAKNPSGSRGCAWKLCRLFFGTLAFLTFAVLAISTFLYFNCTGQKEILPKSRPMCHDIYMYLSTGQKTLTWDYSATVTELRKQANDAATHLVHSMKNIDFESMKSSFIQWNTVVRENIVSAVKYCYTHGGEYANYVYTHGGEYAAVFYEYVKIWSAVAWDAFLHVSRFAVDIIGRVARWTVDFLGDVSENYPAYWEKVKFYWKNTK